MTFALLTYAVWGHLVACARAHTSQITCVTGHYKGRGSWKCSCKSTSAGLCPGGMGAFPLKHPELCITPPRQNCVSLLNQSLGKAEARWFASWLIKARRLWGLAFQFIPKCDTLGRGTLALALQDVASEEESLVPTFAYLYSGTARSPPLKCLCSINLRNRAQLVISPRSLFLLISLQNKSTWMLFVQELNVFFLSSCGFRLQALP